MKKDARDKNSNKLSIREKLCYGFGDVSNGLAVSSISLWLLIYLTDVAGLKPQSAGLAIMIGRIWDALTDPLMGWITDHTESRWGKRRPYLLFGAIPYAIAFFMLWVVPDFGDQVQIFAYVTVALIVFNTCLTVIFVPYTSLTAAITQDYNERTSLTGYRMTSVQIALLVGSLLPKWIVDNVNSPAVGSLLTDLGIRQMFGSWAGTAREGYFISAAILAVIMIISIWTTFFGTRERDLETEDSKKVKSVTPFRYASSIVEELQANKTYRISVLILLLTNCATTFVAVNLPYFIRYVLDMDGQNVYIMACLFVTAIFFVPVWVMLAKKHGKTRTYRVAMLFYVAVLACLPFVDQAHANYVYIAAICAGIFHAAALTLPWAIVPDVVEADEIQTGKRREGLFYGGTTFSYKLATAIPIFFSGSALTWFGYEPNVMQSTLTVNGIKFLLGPIPAVILVVAALVSMRYPLNEEKHKKIIEELNKRRG